GAALQLRDRVGQGAHRSGVVQRRDPPAAAEHAHRARGPYVRRGRRPRTGTHEDTMTRYAAAGALVALLIALPGDVAAATPRPGIAFTRTAYGPALQQPDFRWQGRLEPGKTIEVRGIN